MEHDNLSWSAPQYERYEHSADWYWVVGIITTSIAVAFFIVGNFLLSAIILIGVGILLIHSKHEPRVVHYEISRKGIRAGKTLYHWNSLDSFWIVERDNTSRHSSSAKILITSAKPFMPHIVIPLSDDLHTDEIHKVLSQKITEEFQVEPLPYRLMRTLGF